MADASALQVVIFRDGNLVGSEVFLPGDYALGSDPGCELVLADDVVGRCQAFLSFREGKVTLQNVAADVEMNVNGAPQKLADIRALDDVAIGPFLLKFRVVAQKKAPGAQPQPPAATPVAPVAPVAARPAAPVPAPKRPPEEPGQGEPTIRATVSPAAITELAAIPVQPAPVVPAPVVKPAANPTVPGRGPAAAQPQVQARAVVPPAPIAAPAKAPLAPAPVPVPRVATPAPVARAATPAPAPAVRPSRTPPAASGRGPLDAKRRPRAELLRGMVFEPTAEEKAILAMPEKGVDPGPYLRVRVFWGKTTVGLYGFAPGSQVFAGPDDKVGVAVYRLELPSTKFLLAQHEKGHWFARVPKGQRAFRFEPQGWRPAEGVPDGDATKVQLEQGKLVRLGDANYSIELRVDRARRAPAESMRTLVQSGAVLPFGIVAGLTVALGLVVAFMPDFSKDAADFNPQQMLHAAKAILKPPDKKKEEKKKEEKKKVVEKAEKPSKKTDLPPDIPKTKVQQVNSAMRAVQKVVSAGPAVESLLKATSKLAGGPKGYGDKGMGYKLSPLIGKPPIAMAGMGFGPGMGGFGTQTVGMGAIRGMGGGGGGGIGTFSAGGTGKGKVAGTVVSAPSSGFKQRAGGGSLARELIAKVINEHLGEVRGCYERALLKEAGLAGKLVLEWTIDTNGRVEEIKVKQATIRGAEVPNCIVGSLKGWVFPKPTGGKVVVSYPFLFNSVGF